MKKHGATFLRLMDEWSDVMHLEFGRIDTIGFQDTFEQCAELPTASSARPWRRMDEPARAVRADGRL